MVISKKQHDANRRNSQNSTGPVTQEGKAAAAMNAVTYGLRTRKLIIKGENIADYWRLWSSLEDEWQPETPTERLCLEQMSVSQWLLARMAASEHQIYEEDLTYQARFDLLDRVARHVTRYERSFTTALHELQRLQKERRQQQAAKAKQTRQSAQPTAPTNGQPAPDAAEDHSAFSDPAATDSR
jgi:hypothetical protein